MFLIMGYCIVKLPKSFNRCEVKNRGKKDKSYWVFTKVLSLRKGWGKKRIAIVHEREDLTDAPRFLITNAKNWSGGKMIQEWSYRWPCEVFHEFIKGQVGLEKAQVRNEKAVRKHLCLSSHSAYWRFESCIIFFIFLPH